jgi:hypothetical protein
MKLIKGIKSIKSANFSSSSGYDENRILDFISSGEYSKVDYSYRGDDVDLGHAFHIMRSFTLGKDTSIYPTHTQYDKKEYFSAIDIREKFTPKAQKEFLSILDKILPDNFKVGSLLYFFLPTDKLFKTDTNIELGPVQLMNSYQNMGVKTNNLDQVLIYNYKSLEKKKSMIDRLINKNVFEGILLPVPRSKEFPVYFNKELIKLLLSNPEVTYHSHSTSFLDSNRYATVIRKYINFSYKSAIYTTSSAIKSEESEVKKSINFSVTGTILENGRALKDVEDYPVSIRIVDDTYSRVVDREGNTVGFSNPKR